MRSILKDSQVSLSGSAMIDTGECQECDELWWVWPAKVYGRLPVNVRHDLLTLFQANYGP